MGPFGLQLCKGHLQIHWFIIANPGLGLVFVLLCVKFPLAVFGFLARCVFVFGCRLEMLCAQVSIDFMVEAVCCTFCVFMNSVHVPLEERVCFLYFFLECIVGVCLLHFCCVVCFTGTGTALSRIVHWWHG